MGGGAQALYLLVIDGHHHSHQKTDYLLYASQIRQEYIHYPHEGYCSGRATVLKKFLEHPRIYASERFYNEREEKARANIQAEIVLLERGEIPSTT